MWRRGRELKALSGSISKQVGLHRRRRHCCQARHRIQRFEHDIAPTIGIAIYAIGILVQLPFLATSFYTGPLVDRLGGVDYSWIVGLVVPGILYFVFGRGSRQRAPERMILP
ncbi:MAG: hypothetical protein U1F35_20175 [Steroidobacteraceae bacterium]|nr:hypothetical protein [Pseudomonadota bacterium]